MELTEDQKTLLLDTLKSPGFRLIEQINKEDAAEYRLLATRREVALEDRLWNSAMALGREETLQRAKELVNLESEE